MASDGNHQSIDLRRVRSTALFQRLRDARVERFLSRTYARTLWTGDAYSESTATCVTQCDVQLYMFKKTNGIARALTRSHFENDRYRLIGTDRPTDENAIFT